MGFFELNSFLFEACLAAALLSASSALVGCFLLIRRKALLGDMIGHSVLPGLCVGFILAGFQKTPYLLISGALIAALLSSFLQEYITRRSRIKEDTSMALLLTGFYAVGVVLLSALQNRSGSSTSGLETFLLGSAASISRSDLWASLILIIVQFIIYTIFLKELRASTFDPLFSETQNLHPKRYGQLVSALTSIAVILALPAVGLILASALLILPSACSSLLTKNLGARLYLSACIAFVLGFMGAYFSTLYEKLPTGPSIILLHTIFFFLIAFGIYLKRKTRPEVTRSGVLDV